MKVLCLDDGKTYIFCAMSGYDAMVKMKYCLDLKHRDDNAKIELVNNRTWSMNHSGKTYSALM